MRMSPISKTLQVFLVCLISAFSCIIMPSWAASEHTTDNSLVVGVPRDRSPIFYEDAETHEVTGIGVELMRRAAELAGFKVSFRTVAEPNLKVALDNPAYDVIMPFGSAIASNSGKSSIVSYNLMRTPFTLVTVGNRAIQSVNDLHVGTLTSLAAGAETIHQLYPNMKISLFQNMPESIKALRSGKVDALLHNSYVWSYVLQKPSYNDLTLQPSTLFFMDFRAGMVDTPESQSKMARLNYGISTLSDTQRHAIILEYTSKQLYKFNLYDYLYKYGLVILLGVMMIITALVIIVQRGKAFRRWHERKMLRMSEYDPLTGIYSMNGFRKRVEMLLKLNQDIPYFLSYNNIRDFKFINDSLGRSAGDELLKFWASISMQHLSAEHEAIGRIDADHFAVLRHISEDQIRDDKKNVIIPIHDFFINQGKDFRVQMCSGIYVLTPQDYRKIDVDHMLDLARVAEQRVRNSRQHPFEFYNPEQWEKGKKIAEIINFLPVAIKAGDIQVWYQPQINRKTGKIIGAEALCRWNHSKLGQLCPADFISILEQAGLIFELDCYVWEKVCQDLHRWNEQGERRSVSVNVSRDDIRKDRDIPGYFLNLIKTYQLSPEQLHIEITETAYVENPEILISTTEKLRAFGFHVEMDDFGSGYSSLHMLKEVPIDRIKLDLHFLTASGDPDKCRTIVSCMIQMIRQLGMEMIAEGVETDEQADFLMSRGCTEMQGFYFYKPMPVTDFELIKQEITSIEP